MTRSKKLLATCGSLMATVMLVMSMDVTVQAGKNENCLSELSSGVATVIEPGNVQAQGLLTVTTMELDLTSSEEDLEDLVMTNVKSALNVRSEADMKSEKVGKLYNDCAAKILEQKDGWTKLQSGNLIGWAKDEFLVFGEEAEAIAYSVGKTLATAETDVVCVRKEAGKNSEVFGMLPKGEIVEVVDNSDAEWIHVDFEGVDGYVSAECVTTSFNLDVGETFEEMKSKTNAVMDSMRHVNYGEYTTDADTLMLLAALIHCEAGGESYEGQVAVGAVVMNRVRNAAYPDTIHGVIYASGQFTPAMNGKLNRVYESGKIYESCIKAAQEALAGTSNVGDLVHFRRVDGREGLIIGNHVFY